MLLFLQVLSYRLDEEAGESWFNREEVEDARRRKLVCNRDEDDGFFR